MLWKQLITTGLLTAGFGLGAATPTWAQQPMIDLASIQQQVQQNVNRATSFNPIDASVDQDGVVTLTGFSESESEKGAVVKTARNTPGVTDVKEDIRVIPRFP